MKQSKEWQTSNPSVLTADFESVDCYTWRACINSWSLSVSLSLSSSLERSAQRTQLRQSFVFLLLLCCVPFSNKFKRRTRGHIAWHWWLKYWHLYLLFLSLGERKTCRRPNTLLLLAAGQRKKWSWLHTQYFLHNYVNISLTKLSTTSCRYIFRPALLTFLVTTLDCTVHLTSCRCM